MISPSQKTRHLAITFFSTLLIFIGIAGCSLFSQSSRAYDPTRPNIIIILTDDQPQDTIAFMPILQKELVNKGVNFSNAYVTTPLCCPSRASILSGQYARNHNVLTNRPTLGGAGNLDDSATMATWLQGAGYTTGYIGKYLNAYASMEPYGYIPPGWDDWRVLIESGQPDRYYYDYTLNENGEFVDYGHEEEDYGGDLLVRKALEFINNSAEEPF
ncbi:MAG: sulfatase-like hydrolase/transferase, partial [Chloroflexota bacterium]